LDVGSGQPVKTEHLFGVSQIEMLRRISAGAKNEALTLGVYHRAQTVGIERVGLQAHAVNIAHGPRVRFGNAPGTSFRNRRSVFVAHREHPPPWSRLCLDDDDGVASLLKFESLR